MKEPSRDVRVLIVGDEILSGKTRDANGGWLAERLDALGYRVRRIVVAPDDEDALVEETTRALEAAPVLVVTGGLGPTHDDRTTDVLARLFDRELVTDEAGWTRLQERYTKRYGGGNPPPEMVEAARKMVRIPGGAMPLPNHVGVATGYVLSDTRGNRVIALPGVPAELRGMFDDAVAGKVLPPIERDAVRELDVKLPEARFAGLLERVSREYPDVAIGSYPHWGELRVTIRFRGPAERVDAALARVRADVGAHEF